MIETHVGSPEWVKAQEAEIQWWLLHFKHERYTSDSEGKEKMRTYAKEQMENLLSRHHPLPEGAIDRAVCLEVGSGPIPYLIAWPEAKLRLAIDPLFSQYTAFNHYKMGEKNLGVWCHPFKAENFHYWRKVKFDIIICTNVLDHCDDPRIVLEMMMNNLSDYGFILMDVFLREAKLRDEHPHGWKDVVEFERWIKPILGDHFKVEYARVITEKKQMEDSTGKQVMATVIDGQTEKPIRRIYLKIIRDDKIA